MDDVGNEVGSDEVEENEVTERWLYKWKIKQETIIENAWMINWEQDGKSQDIMLVILCLKGR